MQLRRYRWKKVFFMLLACLAIQMQSAQAAGLQVKLEADKKEYARDEAAWMTLTIKNDSPKDIHNVDVCHVLPNGLEYVASEDGKQYYEVISAGESISCRVRVKRITSDIDISVSSDKKVYEYGEVAALTITIKNNTSKPMNNLSIHHILPNKLEYSDDDEDGYVYFNQIPANSAVTRRVLVSSIYPDVLITLDADQEAYQPNEEACLTMTVKNRSENILKNIRIEHLLPEGLVYADHKENNLVEFKSIKPNETVQCRIYVQYIYDELEEENEENKENKEDKEELDELPMTGDNSGKIFGIAVFGFCISMVLLGLLSKNRKKECRRMN